ncbi:MAG: hypothetical protein QHH01_02575, partial [Spirochaetales bacterium]|nr:hypothetical protein [Spirochaetales bacterium]
MQIIKKKNSNKASIVLFFFLLVIAGCDLTFLRPRQGSLTLNLEAAFEAAHFGPVLSIDSYVCQGEGPGGAAFQRSWNTAGSHTVDALRTGIWNIVVEGLDAELRIVARASAVLEILPNQTTSRQLTLTPLTEGSGTFSLQVDWSALSMQPTAPSLLALATNLDQDQYAIPMTVLGSGAVGSVALPPGYFLLTLTLFDGMTERYTWNPQTFRIVTGFETSITLACDRDDGGGGGGGGGGGAGGTVIWDVGSQKVLHVDFGSDATREITLCNVPAGTLYLGKANNAQIVASATDTGKVNGSLPADCAVRDGILQAAVLVPDHPGALEFVPPLGVAPRRLPAQLDVIHFGEDTPGYVVGTTTRQFWVQNASGVWIQITARLRAASDT